MGKKAAEANTESKAAAPAAKAKAEPTSNAKAKGKSALKSSDVDAPQRLAGLRPKPRPLFFAAFALLCAWLVICYNPCDVKVQKRKDCGYPGISDMQCKTFACFTKGSAPFSKRTIKVKREDGAPLGMSYSVDKDSGTLFVDSVSGGVVAAYNAELPADSEDRILPGDNIVKVDGKKTTKMLDALKAKGTRTHELDIERSRLPSFLRWIHGKKSLKLVERVLAAPGFRQWWRSFFSLGRVGLACWFVSGYPVASVPMYLTLSGAVAFNTARCCHDEKVPGGTAHCYKGQREKPEEILKTVIGQTFQLGERIRASPKSYFDWLLNPFEP